MVLQAAFHPNETVQDVVNHVTECLHASVAHHRFYLYVTPPMQKLDPSKTLADQNLVPAAHAYLSWIDSLPPHEDGSVGFYLQTDLVRSQSCWSDGECLMLTCHCDADGLAGSRVQGRLEDRRVSNASFTRY